MEVDDALILEHVQEVKQILDGSNGRLVKSRIMPQDYFDNLSHRASELKFPEVGISKLVVNLCELVSTLLVEDTDDSKAVSKTIVMIFEYYFLVSPIIFKDQGPRFVNDMIFMRDFAQYVKSLCNSRAQAQKELGNLLVAWSLYNPIKNLEYY